MATETRAPSRGFTVRLGEHATDETLTAAFSALRGVVIDVDGERMVFHRFDATASGHLFVCGVPYPPTPPLDASTEVQITADTVLTIL
jgi:hypothetical protein